MRTTVLPMLFAGLLLFLFPLCATAQAAEKSPEQIVEEFYRWYIEADNKCYDDRAAGKASIMPEDDERIFHYVYPCTVYRLRKEMAQGIMDSGYIVKGNGGNPEISELKVLPAREITETVSVVPMRAGGNDSWLIFLQKTKEGWRIIKIDDPVHDGY